MASHPLSPLTALEIIKASELIRALYLPKIDLHFKAVTLEEPEKVLLVPYLDAEHQGMKLLSLDRKAFVCYYIRNTVSFPSPEELPKQTLGGTVAKKLEYRTNFMKLL